MEDKKPQNEQKSNNSLHPKVVGRAAVVLGLAVLLFSVLLIRILIYQTVSYTHYQQKVLEQMTTESSVNAARGNIYDKNGVLLATNISTYRVFISPSSIAISQKEREKEENKETESGEERPEDADLPYNELIAKHLSEILVCHRGVGIVGAVLLDDLREDTL